MYFFFQIAGFVYRLVAKYFSKSGYLSDGSASTILPATALKWKLQIKTCYLTQSQYTDTGPTSRTTLNNVRRLAGLKTRVPIFKWLLRLEADLLPYIVNADDIVGQQGAVWTRTTKDRES